MANCKLSPRYFGPYMARERIGTVTYRFQLLTEARIHDVFYISQLKRKIGDQMATTNWPAFLNESQDIQKTPVVILDRQLVKRFNKVGTKILSKESLRTRICYRKERGGNCCKLY